MSYAFIRQLTEAAEQYEAQNGNTQDLAAFGAWLQANYANSRPPMQQPSIPQAVQETTESRIGSYIIFLYRYAKGYTKKALEGSPLQTVDEFSFLISLMFGGSKTKTELIQHAVQEKTSGMEVIKRLLQQGLIRQEGDTADRRSKRLYITPEGQQTLFSVFEKMNQVSQIVAGNLSTSEREQLLQLLHKLHLFHKPIFLEQKEASLAEIYAKMVGNS
ncbi:MarR family winged helix-turn-helix transcriptional regulator [Rhodoflexus caldus]|uniref:MarR family winged helix-turn-helix transcriptional regulator n=1 Tax=Rhodoflexus caldus TaxID=2891236 RepID=UPI00202A1298|nr:MarR family winged helix-turn-helix transcriptional regulator [Rhodoflexus caldus]